MQARVSTPGQAASISEELMPLLGLQGLGERAAHGTWREAGLLRKFAQER